MWDLCWAVSLSLTTIPTNILLLDYVETKGVEGIDVIKSGPGPACADGRGGGRNRNSPKFDAGAGTPHHRPSAGREPVLFLSEAADGQRQASRHGTEADLRGVPGMVAISPNL